MSSAIELQWEAKRTDETRQVEEALKRAGFQQVDAYRYNSASIRVRVIDPRFAGIDRAGRDQMVEPVLETLPEQTQSDIISLFLFAPDEVSNPNTAVRQYLMNAEFDNPSPSML